MINKLKSGFKFFFFSDIWNIGIIDKPIDEVRQTDVKSAKWLTKSKADFYADPFGYVYGSQEYILFEYLAKGSEKGIISETNPKSRRPSLVFKSAKHLSYPYIFNNEGNLYCIPEKAGERKVDLYQFDGSDWNLVQTLIDGFPAVDSSIIYWEDKWWLFCGNKKDSPNSKLHLWFADDLLGEWSQHPLNPIKEDWASSRMGGSLFIKNGKIYRPAQNSSKDYGGSISVMEIEKLTKTEFQEKLSYGLKPAKKSAYPSGLHTLSTLGKKTLIDGKQIVFTPFEFFKRLGMLWEA